MVRRQLSMIISLSNRPNVPILAPHIVHISGWISQPKVVRIAATRIIAAMKNVTAARVFSGTERVGYAVCEKLSEKAKFTVSAAVQGAEERPTIFGALLVHQMPKFIGSV